MSKNTQVHITFDFKSIVVLNNEENFIINYKEEGDMKQNLNHLTGRNIMFCKSFPSEPGIYFVSCDKYGKDLYIQSSEAEDISIKLQRDIDARF